MTTSFPTPPLFGTSPIVLKLAIILSSWGGFAAISWLYLDRMSPSADVQNTSGELQLEINPFSGLTLPGEVAGVGMIGPSFPGPTRMGRIWFAEEDISKIQHLSYVSGDMPGLYAMIETLERPLTVAKTYNRVVV
jgi:hypothetical protein